MPPSVEPDRSTRSGFQPKKEDRKSTKVPAVAVPIRDGPRYSNSSRPLDVVDIDNESMHPYV